MISGKRYRIIATRIDRSYEEIINQTDNEERVREILSGLEFNSDWHSTKVFDVKLNKISRLANWRQG